MNIFLFGGSNLTAKFFKKNFQKYFKNEKLISFSRKDKNDINFDLKKTIFPKELNTDHESLFISLAPIWLFVPFLESFLKFNRNYKIKGLIVISSSSVITKKYSWNIFEKNLSKKISYWEKKLLDIKKSYNIKLALIRPTLIYGNLDTDTDKNITFLKNILRSSFLLPIPSETGMRQPIHAGQLAQAIIKISKSLIENHDKKKEIKILNIGGDEELSYFDILKKLKTNSPKEDLARYCLLIKIPNRLFFLLCSPILVISPKTFAKIMRITVDMAGFKPSYKITGDKKEIFPVYQNE